MTQRLGDALIEAKFRSMMNDLGRFIDKVINGEEKPPKNGFILVMFPFEGHEGRCNYISNAKREDVVIMLKEQVKRFEGQPEMKGHA